MPGRTDHTLERKWIITRLPYVLSIFNWIQAKQSNTCFFFLWAGQSEEFIPGNCWSLFSLVRSTSSLCVHSLVARIPSLSIWWLALLISLAVTSSVTLNCVNWQKTNHNLPLKLFLPNQTNSKTLTASRTFITYVHKWKQHGVIQFQVRLH